MTRKERLKKWIKTLNKKQIEKVILDLVEYGIDSEEVRFWESSERPYYSNSGDNLDGTKDK